MEWQLGSGMERQMRIVGYVMSGVVSWRGIRCIGNGLSEVVSIVLQLNFPGR